MVEFVALKVCKLEGHISKFKDREVAMMTLTLDLYPLPTPPQVCELGLDGSRIEVLHRLVFDKWSNKNLKNLKYLRCLGFCVLEKPVLEN